MSNDKLNIRQIVPFFRVEDMEAFLNLYRDCLGFTMVNEWTPGGKIEWC